MKIKNILFDLDGTLIDSKEGILNGLRKSFEKNNLTNIFKDKETYIETLIGPRIEVIFEEILSGENKERIKLGLLVKSFREYYDSIGFSEVRLFDDTKLVLNELNNSKINMFIVTNKPKFVTNKIIDQFNLREFFLDVICSDQFEEKILSKDNMVELAVKKYNLKINETCIVGDQKSDILAGIRNNILPIFANYGYGKINENLVKLNSLKELKNIIYRRC